MFGEKTPLSGAASSATNSFLNSENVHRSSEYAKEKVRELRVMASEGDFSIRLFALLGGFAMMVVSVFGFINTFLHLSLLSALVEVYTFFLGCIVILLEGRKLPFVSGRFRQNLHKYALFLKYVWGRGLLYFVAGSLQLTQGGWIDIAVGGFMCLVGIVYVISGQQTASKLRSLRQSLYSESTLRTKFEEADTDGQGKITIGQFKGLTDTMGLDLNRREVESAFLHMDKEDDGTLTFDEFQGWWNEWDAEDQLGGSPFEFV